MTINPSQLRVTWGMTIYTDKMLKHNRPHITLVHKDTQKWTLNDIAVQADQNIIRTGGEGVPRSSISNQKASWNLESHGNTYRDWCSWKQQQQQQEQQQR